MRAAIISGARTPIGRRGGSLAEFEARDLGAVALAEALERATVDPQEVDDVVMGVTLAPDGNPARVAWLQAGLPVTVPARTIDRQCGSGIDAVWLAAQAVSAGAADTVVAGGAESMTREPFQLERSLRPSPPVPPSFLRRRLASDAAGDPAMGTTAENLAERFAIGREDQDAFAATSQQRYENARAKGWIDGIAAVPTKNGVVRADEHPRPTTTREALAALRPAFHVNGSVTAGNSSGINDGAAAVVVVGEEEAIRRRARAIAWVVDGVVTGVDPKVMGVGPVPAIRRLLARTGWSFDDVDVIEINEAFAVQVLACAQELDLDISRVNAWGGAIAHGHPIAATGTALVMKAVDQLARAGGGRAIVSACIGGGQGIALAIERDASPAGPAGWNQKEN
ncbi:thiolase family protein [Microbacterium suaedae]|uniref:thiolase family protein n=1 Tax=Microbacterium suaedae TaxID=2067813 RepID=UPI0018E08F65|nr:thiolase family protein [Microbacterium suaedae]